jgi:hypothetical protein
MGKASPIPKLVAIATVALVAAALGGRDVDLAWAAGQGGAPPAVSALLTTESTEIDAEGVTRTSRFQERFLRDGGHVWIERVYPAGIVANKAEDEHGVNLRIASRSYEHVAGGAGASDVKVALVSVQDETIVDLAPSELGGLGLSPRWAVASELVDLTRLVPAADAAPAGGTWYTRAPGAAAARDYFRVLWNPTLHLPLVIESGTTDGRVKTRITVEPAPLPASTVRPWTRVGKFSHKDLSDLED